MNPKRDQADKKSTKGDPHRLLRRTKIASERIRGKRVEYFEHTYSNKGFFIGGYIDDVMKAVSVDLEGAKRIIRTVLE